jgi:hypothetical protein
MAIYVVSEKRILLHECKTKIQALQIISRVWHSATTAVDTNMHYLCDVSWCLAMVRERLQASFS